jgi:hypothetical protein
MPNTRRELDVNQWWLKGGVDPRDCLAAFQPIGASGITQSLQNINGRGANNAAIGVTPTFDKKTGWTFDGATTYLTVGTGAIKSGVPLSMICLFQGDAITTLYDLMHVSHSTADSGFKLQAAGATSGDPVRALSELATTEVVATTGTGFVASKWCVGAAVFSAVDARAAYILSDNSRRTAYKNVVNWGDKGVETTSNTPVNLDGTYIGSAYSGAGTALANVLAGKIGACAFYSIALSDKQVMEIGLALHDLVLMANN